MRRLARGSIVSLAGLVLFIGACEDAPLSPVDGLDLRGPTAAIEDAAHSAVEHIYFLPPMVPDPVVSGVFDGSLDPTVEICELDGADCAATQPSGFPIVYTASTGPGGETVKVSAADEHYKVNWHTDEFALSDALFYRIEVRLEGQVIGFADVDVVNSGKDLKNVDTGEFIGLKDGRTLPIKFRLEEGAGVCTPIDGLVAWWTGDGNADDVIGTADGSLVGNTTFVSGLADQAFSLDGSGDYVSAPFAYAGAFTLDLWANANTTSQTVFTSVFSSANPGNYNPHFQIEFDGAGNYRFDGGNSELELAFGAVATAWQHIAITYDGTDVSTYLNGVFVATGTWAGLGATLGFEIVKIGINRDTSRSFDGLVDEVEIYDRALSASEIQDIYNAGGDKCKP